MKPAESRYESNFNGTIFLPRVSGGPPSEPVVPSYIRPTSPEELVDTLTRLRERNASPRKVVAVGAFSSFEFPQLNLPEQGTDRPDPRREFDSAHLVVDMSAMNKVIHMALLS